MIKDRNREPERVTGLREGLTFIWTSSTAFSRIIGVVLIMFAAVSMVQAYVINNEQQTIQRCQTEFVEDMRQSLQARSSATTETQLAVDNLFAAVSDGLRAEGAEREVLQALDEYQQIREQATQDRLNNPYPEISLAEECEG